MKRGGGEKWVKQKEQLSALGKTWLWGVVVINLIWEKKRPEAYMIINPHNMEIIFLSQFWSLYGLPSVFKSLLVSSCRVALEHHRLAHIGLARLILIPRWLFPKQPYHITQIQKQKCFSNSQAHLMKYRQEMSSYLPVQGWLCADACAQECGWESGLSHICKPIIISLLI